MASTGPGGVAGSRGNLHSSRRNPREPSPKDGGDDATSPPNGTDAPQVTSHRVSRHRLATITNWGQIPKLANKISLSFFMQPDQALLGIEIAWQDRQGRTIPAQSTAGSSVAPLVDGQDKDHGPFRKSIASLTKRNVLSEPKPGAGRPGRHDPDQRRRDRCDHVSACPA
jgi:hypothetical protein